MNPILSEFFQGTCFNAYDYFGAHATIRNRQQGVVFRVYAPNAFVVELIGDFNNWTPVQMTPSRSGVFELFWAEAKAGQRYKYRVHAFEQDSYRDRCDPFGRCSELRPNTASIITDGAKYQFSDNGWRAARGNHYNQPINIYEVHAGSWRKHEDSSWLTYRELAESLIPYCKAHFYNYIEFLPLAEHPFDGSWGYQESGYFAVTSRYGTPEDFCYLVDQCHKHGIGVIMDFVPVHFIPDEYALARFDGSTLYEYPDHSGVRLSEWGSCNFDLVKPIVRSFLQSAADFWLTVCHCDGLRFDAIRNVIYLQGDERNGVNPSGTYFLQQCNKGLRARHPHALLIAEDSTNLIKVTAPVQYDGLGFDYKWDLGWMNDTLSYFMLPPEQRPAAHHRLTFSMSYFYDNLHLLPLSHDEVVHGKKALLDKMWGDYDQEFAQCRTLFTYMYTHPGKKLNFMGNELGEFREWDEALQLDWNLLEYPKHIGFEHYLMDLSQFYLENPALHQDEYDMRAFQWLDANDSEHSVYSYFRTAGGQTLLVVLNLSNRKYPNYTLQFDRPTTLRELISSDTSKYGGRDVTNDWVIYSDDHNRAQIILAPLGSYIFRVTQ